MGPVANFRQQSLWIEAIQLSKLYSWNMYSCTVFLTFMFARKEDFHKHMYIFPCCWCICVRRSFLDWLPKIDDSTHITSAWIEYRYLGYDVKDCKYSLIKFCWKFYVKQKYKLLYLVTLIFSIYVVVARLIHSLLRPGAG